MVNRRHEYIPTKEREAVREPARVNLMGGTELVVREVPVCIQVEKVTDFYTPHLHTTAKVDCWHITQTDMPIEEFAEMQAEQIKQDIKKKLIEKGREAREQSKV